MSMPGQERLIRLAFGQLKYEGIVKTFFYAIIAIFLGCSQSFAQNATSIQGVPVAAPPSGMPGPGYQPCPNCASMDGLSLTYRTAPGGSDKLMFGPPAVAGGPSNWPPDSNPAHLNKALPGYTWTWIDTDPTYCSTPPLPGPYCFFRSGFTAYPNGGYWNLRDGIATIDGLSNVEYDIAVYVGTYLEPHTGYWAQPDMYNGGPLQDHYQYVGGGGGGCPGPTHSPCQIKFSAHLIYCGANGGTGGNPIGIGPIACEIRVAIYPKTADNSAVLLGLIAPDPVSHQGGVPMFHASGYYLEQQRGL